MRKSDGCPEAHDGLVDRSRSILPLKKPERVSLVLVSDNEAPAPICVQQVLAAIDREDDVDRMLLEDTARARLARLDHDVEMFSRGRQFALALLVIERASREGWESTALILEDPIQQLIKLAAQLSKPGFNVTLRDIEYNRNGAFALARERLEKELSNVRS